MDVVDASAGFFYHELRVKENVSHEHGKPHKELHVKEKKIFGEKQRKKRKKEQKRERGGEDASQEEPGAALSIEGRKKKSR